MSDILERLDKLKTRIQEEDFLKGNGLSNEVNIHIFCYDPADEMAVRYFTEQLVSDRDLACHVIEKNLYKRRCIHGREERKRVSERSDSQICK